MSKEQPVDLELAKREKVLIDNGLMKPTWEYST